jgi:hypothetical protein
MPKQKALSGGFWVGVSGSAPGPRQSRRLSDLPLNFKELALPLALAASLKLRVNVPLTADSDLFDLGTEWPWQPVVLPGPGPCLVRALALAPPCHSTTSR